MTFRWATFFGNLSELYRGRQNIGPRLAVFCMLVPGRSGRHEQEQHSQNLGPTCLAIPVRVWQIRLHFPLVETPAPPVETSGASKNYVQNEYITVLSARNWCANGLVIFAPVF